MKRSVIVSCITLFGIILFSGLLAVRDISAANGAQEAEAARYVIFDYNNNNILVNGQPAQQVYPMTNHNGRIYVAARQIAEAFGYTAEWDPKSYDAILRNDNTRIHVNEVAKQAWVNDRPVPFEGLGFVHQGRLLLSIRAIAEHMGLYVDYDAELQQAIVADAHYPYVHSVDRKRSGFIPIDFAAYTTYPIITPSEHRDTSRSLMFSDSPEVFYDYGVLYRDTLEGKSRLFLTHVNGMNEEATVGWVATNDSDRPVSVTITRQGAAAKSKDYAGQGRSALAIWHSSGKEIRKSFVIEPNSSAVLYESDALRYYEAVHAIFDVESSGPVQYDVLAYKDAEGREAGTASASYLKKDVHDRGTFPVSDIKLLTDRRQWAEETPARIRIGEVGSLNDHWVQGIDALTGEPAQNFGNYGVFYEVTVSNPGKAAFVLVPLRGLYKGAATFQGQLVQTDTMKVGDGYLLGRTSGTESQVRLQVSAASGSYMPFEILVYPLP